MCTFDLSHVFTVIFATEISVLFIMLYILRILQLIIFSLSDSVYLSVSVVMYFVLCSLLVNLLFVLISLPAQISILAVLYITRHCALSCFIDFYYYTPCPEKKSPRYFQLQLSHSLVDFYNYYTVGKRNEHSTVTCNLVT